MFTYKVLFCVQNIYFSRIFLYFLLITAKRCLVTVDRLLNENQFSNTDALIKHSKMLALIFNMGLTKGILYKFARKCGIF